MTMTFSPEDMERELRAHSALCSELLAMATQENQALRSEGDYSPGAHDQRRKDLIPRLDASLTQLRNHRLAWQQLTAAERARHPEIPRLIRATQELAMKMIVLDRENEQVLLRRGLVPARHLSGAQQGQQQPHFVAKLYQRYKF